MIPGKKISLIVGASALVLSGFILNKFGGRIQADTQPANAQTLTTLVQTNLAQRSQPTLKVAFPSRADSTDLQRKANDVARFLSQELNMPVEAIVSDDTAAVEALRANRVDVAFLSSRPALKAEQLAKARIFLAEVRPNYSGRYTYSSVMVVRKDSPLSRKATTKQTLEQLRGKKIAFTSPTSGSGFIFPVGDLVKQGLVPNRDRLNGFFQQVTYGGNYSSALQAVLRRQVDVAAVSEYALKPPYITEAEGKQLRRLYSIAGVPAHSVAIDDDVPVRQRTQIINALLKLNQPRNNALLKNLYNSTELVQVDHTRHLQPMRDALQRAGIAP